MYIKLWIIACCCFCFECCIVSANGYCTVLGSCSIEEQTGTIANYLAVAQLMLPPLAAVSGPLSLSLSVFLLLSASLVLYPHLSSFHFRSICLSVCNLSWPDGSQSMNSFSYFESVLQLFSPSLSLPFSLSSLSFYLSYSSLSFFAGLDNYQMQANRGKWCGRYCTIFSSRQSGKAESVPHNFAVFFNSQLPVCLPLPTRHSPFSALLHSSLATLHLQSPSANSPNSAHISIVHCPSRRSSPVAACCMRLKPHFLALPLLPCKQIVQHTHTHTHTYIYIGLQGHTHG